MTGTRNSEALKRRIEELEKRLAEYEKQGLRYDLREVTKRLEKIAEMGDDGIIVFGEDSRIEFANQMAADIFDISKEDILGSEFYRLIGKSD
ncbi:MAG TPA: PAS domain-containing protein, partial [Syntrophales bacterium]|nr:PAS domain-containing protein [Syntrophales bacterium]